MSLKDKIAARAQQALAIDDLRAKIDTTIGHSERVHAVEKNTAELVIAVKEVQAAMSAVAETLARYNERLTAAEPWLPEAGFTHSEPEYYLAAFLYNFLPDRVIFDVGANEGDFMEVVADAGYEVFCFEPFPEAFERLRTRAATRNNVTVFNFALGSREAVLPFFVATESGQTPRGDASLFNTLRPHFVRDTIRFEPRLEVPVHTIASLVEAGRLPAAIDFLKVDTEGFDLEVIEGLGDLRPRVVQTEFWGKGFVFVRDEPESSPLVNSPEVIRKLRARGYWWNLVIFRIEGEHFIRLATNLAEAPLGSWGNLLFFREYNLFAHAFHWCQSALPRFQSLT